MIRANEVVWTITGVLFSIALVVWLAENVNL